MADTYKNSGVDIDAGNETVEKIKTLARSTFNNNVLSEIGLFGGFYELKLSGYKQPVLVSSVDGVGTKLKIAFQSGTHNTIGQDLVNHCVNDIAVCGAQPLYFLDYIAFGKLNPNVAEKIVEGYSKACKENGCTLIGGETAEMPGLYSSDEYDMSGTIVGIVEKNKIINGKNIKKGDVLIGFPSNGLHTNGYSLARKVLLSKYNLNDKIDELGSNLSEELLRIHRSYLKIISHLKTNINVKGFSHITGGGIIGNTMRIIPEGMDIEINWDRWEIPAVFKLIKSAGNISDDEMRKVFNLGIGLIAVVSKENEYKAIQLSNDLNEHPLVIGNVI